MIGSAGNGPHGTTLFHSNGHQPTRKPQNTADSGLRERIVRRTASRIGSYVRSAHRWAGSKSLRSFFQIRPDE